MHRSFFSALVVGAIAGYGCTLADTAPAPTTVTDSAGVRIVTSERPRQAFATLAEHPTVDIGGPGDAHGELAHVAGAIRLGDGRIALAEQSTLSIRIFDGDGTLVRSFGRRGRGPGEFVGISALIRLGGDSIGVWDPVRTTLTVFDSAGALGPERRLTASMGGLQLHGLLADGSMMLSRGYNPQFYRTPRVERDTVHYLLAAVGDVAPDTIAAVPGTETFAMSVGDVAMRRDRAFGRVTVIGVRREDWLSGTSDRYEIEVRGPDARVRQLWRIAHEPPPVTAADIERYKREELDEARTVTFPGAPPDFAASAVDRIRRVVDQMIYPETHPAYDSVIVATTGEVWVRSPAPFRGEARVWTVFSADGAALGVVSTPPGMRLYEVGRDYALALTRDDDEVEHVGLYRLSRR